MNAETVLARAWRVYRGKGATKTPTWGSEKANLVLLIMNQKQEEWAHDPDQTWASNFGPYAPDEVGTVSTLGTVVTGTDTYFTDYQEGDTITVSGEVREIDTIVSDTSLTVTSAFSTLTNQAFTRQTIVKSGVKEYSLNRRFYTPSDSITITTTLQDVYYNFVKPQLRSNGGVYIYGRQPKKLVFTSDPSTQVVGGELKASGYYAPAEMVNSTDLVSVDDPNWLVYAVASELARNDPAKDTEFGNIIGMANDLYSKMVKANIYLGLNQSNSVPYAMPTIVEDWCY